MESIFERDFYPTPTEVIELMMSDTKVEGKIVLEPSVGSGNIVDWLKAYGAREVIACETNNKLRSILGAKCNLIGDDFLKLTSTDISHIDLIVMNPPFSADAQHILHAYNIAPGGCEIISLCNYETVSNSDYATTRRKLKELIDEQGYYRDLGECFTSAERRTNVQVACIRLFKPQTGDGEFDGYFSEEEDMGEFNRAEGLMPYNLVRDVVNRYVDAVSRFDAAMEASEEINQLTQFIGGSSVRFGEYKAGDSKYSPTTITRDYFKKQLQRESWQFLFSKMNMRKYVTNGVMDQINCFVELQTKVPFTMRNVYLMMDAIVQTNGQRMNQVLIDAFEKICSFSADNSTAGEKWKTNSNYTVNRKFIMPYICRYDARWPGETVDLEYCGRSSAIDDIIKALCHLTDTNYDETTDLSSFVRRTKMEWGKWCNWGFFRIRGYKKGTMHFEFEEEKLWMLFNTEVARSKGWELPQKSNKMRSANGI